MTNYDDLSIERVLYLHEMIIERAGGKQGVRDYTLLHSALERCKVTFAEKDLYPDLYAKAAALWHSLTMNHPFLDGNKRTAYETMKRFLFSNGLKITAPAKEVIRFCISIDNDQLELRIIRDWVKEYTKKL